MKIRKAQISDSSEILKILNTTKEFQPSKEDNTYTPEFVKGAIQFPDRNLVLLSEEDGKMTGFLIAELWKEKKYSFFCDLFVKPEYRGKGVASALEEEYEKICEKLGLRTIIGLVLVDNKRMQKWAGNHGFVKGNKVYFYEKKV